MAVIEYCVEGITKKEEIGNEELEKVFDVIEKYALDRILIYNYDYKYFEIQKYLYRETFRKFDLDYLLCYNQRVIGIYSKKLLKSIASARRRLMGDKGKLVFEIPYGYRDEYIDVLYEINKMVSRLGMVGVFAYNNPILGSKLYVVIETNDNYSGIQEKIAEAGLSLTTERSFETMFSDHMQRRASYVGFSQMCTKEEIKMQIDCICLFPTFSEMKKRGISMEHNEKQKKVFISYSHKNKKIVYEFEEQLQKEGINFWIDKRSIDVGEHIIESMMNGVEESDLALIFLSEEYMQSIMCRLEIRTFFTHILENKKKWFLVNLDGVDLDKVYTGFHMYKYYRYSNVEELKRTFMGYYNKNFKAEK